MENKNDLNGIIKSYEVQNNSYKEYVDILGANYYEELNKTVSEFRGDSENAKESNRLLRIGIIGQIKRGKSSFLNSLLFEGADILPKAATPMTAALTAIKYAETPKANVEYYNEKDWGEIKEYAKKFKEIEEKGDYSKIPAEYESCKQLVEMASELDIENYLGKTEEIKGYKSIQELGKALNNYVGAEGRYTPLVKYSELYLNIEVLKNIEVVDTPGLNDPIVSRAAKTKDFIGKCDVVFLLSSCSQFLPTMDMSLLKQNIPSKGITDIVLIGSRLDDSILDVYDDFENVYDAVCDLKTKYSKKAKDILSKLSKNNENRKDVILSTLEKALPPIFVSAMFYNIAKHFGNLSSEEANYYNNYNGMFEGFTFSQEYMMELANFKEVEAKLKEIKERKEEILDHRLNELVLSFKSYYKDNLIKVDTDVNNRYDKLIKSDIQEITLSYNGLINKIKSGKSKFTTAFESNIIAINQRFAELKLSIKEEGLTAKKILTQEHSETRSYEVSASKWYNPFSWGSSETRYHTISYTYANVNQAVEQLEEFVLYVEKSIMQAIKEIINIKKFRDDVLSSIKDLFDFNDDNFNPQDIIGPLEVAVKKITVPNYNIDVEKHINGVRNSFKSSKVKDDEISALRNEQSSVVGLITKDIYSEMDMITKNIIEKLEVTMSSFIPGLISDLTDTAENLKKQLEDKEKSKSRFEQIIKMLKANLSSL